MNDTTIINTFNSDNNNIANIKRQHHQIMRSIANRNLKFKTMIRNPIVGDNTFFTVIFLATSNHRLKSNKSIL